MYKKLSMQPLETIVIVPVTLVIKIQNQQRWLIIVNTYLEIYLNFNMEWGKNT